MLNLDDPISPERFLLKLLYILIYSGLTGFKSNETKGDDDSCFTLLPIINYGICTPDSCSNYDIKKMLQLGNFLEFEWTNFNFSKFVRKYSILRPNLWVKLPRCFTLVALSAYKTAESALGHQIVCHVDIVCGNDLPQSRLSHDFTSLCVL